MSEITPENVQEKLNLFQQIQQQVQSLSQQISQIDMSIGETERTLEEIKDLGKKATLYRAIGSVMKKIDDPKQLKKDLEEEKERMEIRNNSLKGQVQKMNEELEQMQKQLAPVLQNIQENKVTNAPK
ncbi:MAG: prefoldin subunit beta [Candidatus Poseidoniia archaeon]|nr:prefoldin subunit beta [Candidatus Poseidoniia archaeon]|tara:strand:+ start:59 stop:439 length:381 start_codon:yes stop_codon:yes gene_type:complete